MKTLYESLLDDDLIGKTDNMIKDEIEAFLKENYKGSIKISNFPNKDGKYEVSSSTNIEVKNKKIASLTNEYFVWVEVDRHFDCSYCNKLTSLKGAPKVVGGGFSCSGCSFLESLEGAPEKVGSDFYCSYCDSLKSLEGAPKEVGGDFYCSRCNSLKSLEGAPEKVPLSFSCNNCQSLKTLEGAPKKVGAIFHCSNCAGKFTIKDVKKVSNVKYEIMC